MHAGRIAYLIAIAVLLPSALFADPIPETEAQPPGPDFVHQESRVVTHPDGATFEVVTRTDPRGQRQVTMEPIAVGTAALATGAEGPVQPIELAHAAATNLVADRWSNIGPDGGTVLDVNASPLDPQFLLAGLDDPAYYNARPTTAVYRSTDGGATWSPSLSLERGFGNYTIAIRAIEFSREGIAFAAGDQGVFRSEDHGATWTRLLPTYYPNRVLDVAIEPGDSRRIWVGLDGQGSSPSIQRSIDGGATWQTIAVPLTTPLGCRSIAFDPARPGRVYAAFGRTPYGQIWLSLDGGATWTNRSATLPGSPLNKVVIVGNSVMVAAGEWVYGAQYGGLYVSDGDTGFWRAINRWPTSSFGEVVENFAVDPTDPCTIWVATPKGIFGTTNCGETWTTDYVRFGITAHAVRAFAGPVPTVLAGAESYAVMKLQANGTFQSSSHGIHELNVGSVSANPLDPDELAAAFNAANSGGIYTSIDGGQNWTLAPTILSRVASVDFAPDGTLYAISDGPSDVATEGVYRRTADGRWWAYGPHRGPYFETELQSVAFAPDQPGLVVTAGNDWITGRPIIFRSTDSGFSWSQVHLGPDYGTINRVAFAGAGSTRAVLASYRFWSGPGGVLRSANDGISWAGAAFPINTWPHAFSVSARDPNLVYVTNTYYQPGMFRSGDAGLTWQSITSNYGPFRGAALHPDDDRELYGIGPSGDLARSHDGGLTFLSFLEGMSPLSVASDLFAQPGDCPRLYAATSTGVYARVVDRAPPHLQVSLDHDYLWPPNHELMPIHASVEASDVCDPDAHWKLLSITSDEPAGSADPDIVDAQAGTPDVAFALRAAREGAGDGRTYTIVYQATDAAGNSVKDTVQVVAPHDQSGLPNGVVLGGARATGDVAVLSPRLIPSAAGGATLRFGLAHSDRVRVDVYDLLGARVRTLLDAPRSQGGQEVAWDGRDASGRSLPSGVYLVRLLSGQLRWSGKAVVVR